MDISRVVLVLLVGLASGWTAGVIMKGHGFGVFGDILVGILGAFVGAWLFTAIGLVAYGTLGFLIMSIVGASALLALIGLVRHA